MKKILFLLILPIWVLLAKENLSLLVNQENSYGEYLKTITLEQNLEQEDIKKLLEEKRLSVRGSMIRGMYQQYYKKDIEKASFYFDEILKKVPALVKNTSHSLYIADYLVIKDNFNDIKKILDINYCNTLLTKDAGKCAYYVFLSKKGTDEETLEERSILNQKENRLYKTKLETEGEL